MFCIKNQLFSNNNHSRIALRLLKRYKSKKGVSACESALNHFDDFYKSIFTKHWQSIRLGLLSQEKYVAIVNNFGDTEKTTKMFEDMGALDFRSYLEIQKDHPRPNENVINQNDGVSDVILNKLEEEERKEEGYIYPKDKETGAKARFVDKDLEEGDDDDVDKRKDEYFYDPEEATTSLHSDMADANYETDRLILPGSKINESSLYEYIPATELRGLTSYIPESEYYKYYKDKASLEISVDPEFTLQFPDDLKVFTFDRGDVTEFPMPKRCANDVYSFLPVDGAELLCALALGVETGDNVLNISPNSAHTGYCILQSLKAKNLVCCYSDEFDKIFSNHLYDYSSNWKDMVLVTKKRFDKYPYESLDLFDKILLNVQCTNDRKSLFVSEENIFSPARVKIRITLPEFQTRSLVNAMKMIRPGGTVLYTTCTLSPVQNDGVVNEALKIAWEESKLEFTVKNLTPALEHTSIFYRYGNYLNLKFGTLVLPFVPSNFGPRYFCKIVRNE